MSMITIPKNELAELEKSLKDQERTIRLFGEQAGGVVSAAAVIHGQNLLLTIHSLSSTIGWTGIIVNLLQKIPASPGDTGREDLARLAVGSHHMALLARVSALSAWEKFQAEYPEIARQIISETNAEIEKVVGSHGN